MTKTPDDGPTRAHPSMIPHDLYDRGARGPAAQSRPAAIDMDHEGKSRGSIRTERIQVVKYADESLYDRLWQRAQISDKQHKAATKLAGRWTAAGMNPQVCARIETIGTVDDGTEVEHDPDPNADPDETALDRYRQLMRQIPARHAVRLESMLLSQHPGVRYLCELQDALDWLVGFWDITDDKD